MVITVMNRRTLTVIQLVVAISWRCRALDEGDACTMRDTELAGICRLYDKCLLAAEQSRNGINPTICGYRSNVIPIVCCQNRLSAIENIINGGGGGGNGAGGGSSSSASNSKDEEESSIMYPSNSEDNASNSKDSISKQRCREYLQSYVGSVAVLPLVPSTVTSNLTVTKCTASSVPLIVGGEPAAVGEFPFMAAIGFRVDGEVEWRCGGTLISKQYVLTAAHCTFSRDVDKPTIVRLGDLDLETTNDNSEHEDFNIERIVVHPDYTYPYKYNDIALIKLSRRVRFTKVIRPACLYSRPYIGETKALATGWGKTDYAAAETNSKLMKVSLHIFSNSMCEKTYSNNKNLPYGIISTMLCAGELHGGKDTCQGDSGGPLVLQRRDNICVYNVIGITSFGKSCGQANTPAIYTRVYEFLEWIENVVW